MTDYDPNYIPKKTYFLVGQKAILINSENKILLLQRSDKAGAGGKWNLPGGGLEEGEDPIESIKREIEEEAGLLTSEISLLNIKSIKNEDNILMTCYLSRVEGEVKINWEHDDLAWVTKEEALGMDITEVTRYFVKNYEA